MQSLFDFKGYYSTIRHSRAPLRCLKLGRLGRDKPAGVHISVRGTARINHLATAGCATIEVDARVRGEINCKDVDGGMGEVEARGTVGADAFDRRLGVPGLSNRREKILGCV